MLDLTKIEKNFGFLDVATKNALVEYAENGGKIEIHTFGRWEDIRSPTFHLSATYRAKPEPRVIKARYGVGKAWSNELPSISNTNFGADHWRVMTGEIVVGDDGWPSSITLTREGAE